jgi:hypothetical protein
VERSEAEGIYAAGRKPVVEALLALSARLEAPDAQLAALSERVKELEQRLKRDSSNASLPRVMIRRGWGGGAGRGGQGGSRELSLAMPVMGARCFRLSG